MDEIIKGKSIKEEFEAQVTAALMIQSNALIPIKLAVRLCGITKKEIMRALHVAHSPSPEHYRADEKQPAWHFTSKTFMTGSKTHTCTSSLWLRGKDDE